MRRVLLLPIALLIAAPGASAATTPVGGEVLATAYAGDALVVARRPERGAIRVEVRRPGQGPKVVLTTTTTDSEAAVLLAASDRALAVSLAEDPDDDGGSSSRVWIGAPTGPVREVAACVRSVTAAPVAVDGTRVAWGEGGCAGATGDPTEIGPGAFVFGDVDATLPVRRVPVPDGQLPTTLKLRDGAALAGLLRPSFLSFFATDVRAVLPEGLGPVRTKQASGFLEPVGLLADGAAVLARLSFSLQDEYDFDDEDPRSRCSNDVSVLAPGSDVRRPLEVGGCPAREDEDIVPATVVAGDRIFTRVLSRTSRRSDEARPAAITSVRPDGSDRKTIVTGTYRKPLGLAANGSQVAWWQDRCLGGQELVTATGPVAATRSCTVEVLTRRARVRNGRASLRVRCAAGCRGTIVDESVCGRQPRATFTIARGTRTIRLIVPRRQLRSGRVLLRIGAPGGPTRRQLLRVAG